MDVLGVADRDDHDFDDDDVMWMAAAGEANAGTDAEGSKSCGVCARSGMLPQARFCGYCGSRFPATMAELLPTQEHDQVLALCAPPSVGSLERSRRALPLAGGDDGGPCDMDTVADNVNNEVDTVADVNLDNDNVNNNNNFNMDCNDDDDEMDMEMLRVLEQAEQRIVGTPEANRTERADAERIANKTENIKSEQTDANAAALAVSESVPRRQLPSWMLSASAQSEQSRHMRDHKEAMRAQPIPSTSAATASVTYRMVDTLAGGWWKQQRVIVFDVETTGFGKTDCLLEIGAVELWDGRRTGVQFQSHMRPLSTATIHPMARACHGLSDAFLAAQPAAAHVVHNFVRFVGDSALVAHHADFDMRLLCQELDRLQLPLPGNSVFCTMRYERRVHSTRSAYTLSSVAAARRIAPPEKLHGALVDAQLCAAVFTDMLDDLQSQQFARATSAEGPVGPL